ncbi:MAG: hypothetical protein KDK36_21790, partial [Leptospiraceae bacterium]|nr:hypothetical protein [Leptospiraceae bacterium]
TNGADFLREGGATGTIDVHLSFDPGADAVVTVTSGNSNSLSVSPSTLTFDSSNYMNDKQVTLTALNDTNQTSEDVTVLFTTTGATPQIHPLKTIDDDIQIIISGATSVNEGGQATVLISLSGDPGESRVINLSSSDTNAVTLSTNSLTFTSANYSQSVFIYGVEDTNVASESITITASPAVGGGITGTTSTVSTIDNDSMNIMLSGLGSTMVNEGLTTTFKVNLTHDPGGDLTVNFGSSYSGVTVTPSSFTFNSSNYNSQQTITINALQDANQDSETVTITASATGVTTSPTIQVTTIEDDTVPVITGNTTVAEGGFTVLNLKLSGNPGNNRTVTLDLIGTTSSVSLSSNTFEFTPFNYNASQTFIISGLQDVNVVKEDFTVRATLDGVNYIPHPMETVDEDSLELIVTNVGGTTLIEGNGTTPIKFKMKLNFEPTSDVVINFDSMKTSPTTPGYENYKIISSDVFHGGLSTSFPTLTFTPSNYNTEQEVSVYAIENLYIDDYNTQLYINSTGGFTKSLTYDILVKHNDPIDHKIATSGKGPILERPSIAYDSIYTNQFLIAATYSGDGRLIVPYGSMCSYDGGCFNDVSIGTPNYSGYQLNSLMADTWVMVGINQLNSKIVYFRSVRFGSQYPGPYWSYITIAENMGVTDSFENPSSIVDTINNKILVAANNRSTNHISIFRFNIDGSLPSDNRFYATYPDTYLFDPSVTIDKTNQKLIVASNEFGFVLSLKHCDLDISNCTDKNIFNQTGNLLWYPFVLIDEVSIPNKLIVVGTAMIDEGPGGFICDLDGSNCTFFRDFNHGYKSGKLVKAVIDKVNKKLLIVSYNHADNLSLALFRCELNGTNCKYRNLSGWLAADAGAYPQPYIVEDADPHKRKLVVFTQNNAYGKTISMFSMMLYID